jgi:hypothetical protein
MMDRKATTADLLALRDGDPLDAYIAAEIRGDAHAQQQIDQMRDIQAALRQLPNTARPGQATWAEIENRVAQRSAQKPGRWRQVWPMGLVASIGLLAGLLLAGKGADESALEASRTNLVALQEQSRQIETQLMRTSAYSGSPSEQALMFRLADVDAQLAMLASGAALDEIRQRELLWQQRIELMRALQAVQPPAQPAIQYAVY